MKAVILAGGVDRPFLRHQLDLLRSVGVRDVILSLAYRPERIQAVLGDGRALGMTIRYAVEETPLGTGGAVKNAEPHLDSRTIVLNGDVLTDVDLPAVVARHEASQSAATLVLAPVANPAAYGLVETDPAGRVLRFIEKPEPSQITTDTVNAGIYVLETSVLELMPPALNHSIERAFFPSLLARGDRVGAWVHRGYWIDIGTPEKYLQVHRDILRGRFRVSLSGRPQGGGWIHGGAEVDGAARLEGPFYVGPGCRIAAGAHLGPDAVLVADVRLGSGARVADSVVWAGTEIAPGAHVEAALLGSGVRMGCNAIARGVVLGEGTVLSDFSRPV
jgi:mannose-1-phosphate guanylyltransferase